MISTCEAKIPSWPNHPLTTSVTVELQKGQKKFNDLEKRVTEFAATCPSVTFSLLWAGYWIGSYLTIYSSY